jgi:hypothetical protein
LNPWEILSGLGARRGRLRRLHLKVDLRCLVLGLVFAQAWLPAQTSGAFPGPDSAARRAQPARGFGTVSGIVLNDATGKPLNRAQVILKPLDADGSSRLLSTIETGVFEFDMVRSGRYTFVVQRDGYLSQGGSGPQFSAPAEQFTVSNNAQLGSFMFRLHPAGVIAGRVKYGSDAEPAVGAVVELYKEFRLRGRHGFALAASTLTDDLGEYRVHGVPPGSYFVSATRQRPPEAAGATQEPRRDGSGRPLPDEVCAVTFYPNGQKLADAVAVKIAYGSEATGTDIFLESVPAVRIRGRVTSALGGVPESVSILVHRADAQDGAAIRAAYDVIVNPKTGAFEIHDVTPGPYVLTVDASDAGLRLTARRFVEVSEAPIDDVEILAEPPWARKGHVLVEGGNPAMASNIRVAFEPRDQSAGGTSAVTGDYGEFSVFLQPGATYDVFVRDVPAGAWVKSIRVAGNDVLRDGLTAEGRENEGIEIHLATDGGKATGSVIDRTGKPVTDAQVTLIPDPPDGRLQQYASAALASDGSFTLSGLAPGHYLILASPGDPPCDIYDPADLAACRRVGQPFQVSSSGQAFLPLQMP